MVEQNKKKNHLGSLQADFTDSSCSKSNVCDFSKDIYNP